MRIANISHKYILPLKVIKVILMSAFFTSAALSQDLSVLNDSALSYKYRFKMDSCMESLFNERQYQNLDLTQLRQYYDFLKKEIKYCKYDINRKENKSNLVEGTILKDSTLSSEEIGLLTNSELICVGNVISLRRYPLEGCNRYHTTYLIVVNDVLFSMYDISIGDTIVLKSQEGFIGPDCREGGDRMHVGISHYTPYDTGDVKLFSLTNVNYFIDSIHANKKSANINYKISPYFFTNFDSNVLNNDFDKIPYIKDFLTKYFD